MYQQKDLTCITRNILLKYQNSSTYCLNVLWQPKVSDRFTELQKDGITERNEKTAVILDSRSTLKTDLSSKSFYESMLNK